MAASALAQSPPTGAGGQGTSSPASSLPKIDDAVDPKNDTQPARVNAIHFFGNTKVPTELLLSRIGVVPGEVMAKEKMGMAMDRIVEEYRRRGLDVEIRPRVSHPKQNFVDINFLINEQGKGGHD